MGLGFRGLGVRGFEVLESTGFGVQGFRVLRLGFQDFTGFRGEGFGV